MKKISMTKFLIIESVIALLFLVVQGIFLKVNIDFYAYQAYLSSLIFLILLGLLSVYECLYQHRNYVKLSTVFVLIVLSFVLYFIYNEKESVGIIGKPSAVFGYCAQTVSLVVLLFNGFTYLKLSKGEKEEIKVARENIEEPLKEDKISIEQMWGIKEDSPASNDSQDYDRNSYFNDAQNESPLNTQTYNQNRDRVKSQIPIGYYSKKEKTLYILSLSLVSILSLVGFFFIISSEFNVGISFALIFAILVFEWVCNFIIMIVKTRYDERYFIEFEKTLDLNSFDKNIDSLLQNDLDSQTKNYLYITQKYYYTAISYEKASSIEVEMPTIGIYFVKYVTSKLFYHLLYNQKDKFIDFYNQVKETPIYQNKRFQKTVLEYKKYADLCFGHQLTGDINVKFPINKKNQFKSLMNALLRARYYDELKDYSSRNQMIDYINQNCSCLREFQVQANDLINKDIKE